MRFKDWFVKTEGLISPAEPPQERPDQMGQLLAKQYGVGAYEVGDLPGTNPLPGNKVMMKKRMKKKMKS